MKNTEINKNLKYVYLVHYDNATHEPEFAIFEAFKDAMLYAHSLMDKSGSDWNPDDISDKSKLWQWTDKREYISIWKEVVR